MISRKRAFPLCLAAALLLTACSKNTIVYGPENLSQDELAFFPLAPGYTADYAFSLDQRYEPVGNGDRISHSYEGTFRLEVVDFKLQLTELSMLEGFYRIKTTLNIQREHYSRTAYPAGDSVAYTVSDSTVTAQYDLFYRNFALYYVQDAPDFEHLDRGRTSPMLSGPVACGGNMDLKLFECLELIDLSSIPASGSTTGNTCTYHSESRDGDCITKDVVTQKAVGIKSISYSRQACNSPGAAVDRTVFSFELLD